MMRFKGLQILKTFALPNLKIPKIECIRRIRKARRNHVIGNAFIRYGSVRSCLMHIAVTSNFTKCATTLLVLTMITVSLRLLSLQIICNRLIENGRPNFPSELPMMISLSRSTSCVVAGAIFSLLAEQRCGMMH